MNKLYHLHIPRTSGTGILYSIQKSFALSKNNKEHSKSFPEIFEFYYDKEKMKNWPLISGHFAINPIIENNQEIDVFSIIRKPVDQFVSIAAYRAMSANKKFDIAVLDEFLEGKEDSPLGCKLFSSDGNLQTKMLTCRIFPIKEIFEKLGCHVLGFNPNPMFFTESDMPTNEDELINKIKNIKLFEINERELINNYLIKQFKEKFKCDFISAGNHKVNSSVRSTVIPSPSQIREIENRNQMDMVLYDYVMSNGGEL